jgi:hypothetical protein
MGADPVRKNPAGWGSRGGVNQESPLLKKLGENRIRRPTTPSVVGLFEALTSAGVGAWPKGQDLGFFVAAVRALKRVNGRAADGRVKIDDGVSYRAAACRAGVVDSEVHVRSFRSRRRRTIKGSAKIVMLRGCSGALRWRLNRARESGPCRTICRVRRGRLSTECPQISTASTLICVRQKIDSGSV